MKASSSYLSPLRLERALFFASVSLYLVSLGAPAYYPVIRYADAGVYYGWLALMLGPIGLLGGHFSWLANPLLWCSWRSYRRAKPEWAVTLAALASALAFTFLFGNIIPVGSSGSYPYEVRFGYYAWLASAVTMVLAATVAARTRVQPAPTNAP